MGSSPSPSPLGKGHLHDDAGSSALVADSQSPGGILGNERVWGCCVAPCGVGKGLASVSQTRRPFLDVCWRADMLAGAST